MVQVYESEQEQIDALKTWWSENAVSVIAGIVIGVGGLVGWNYWQAKVKAHEEAASSEFIQVMQNVEDQKFSEIPALADTLVAEYKDTHYSSLGQMAAARAAVKAGNADEAKTRLEWVIKHASTENFELIGRLRLATVQLATGDNAAAKSTLDVKFPESYDARVNELLGDIAVAEGDKAAARLAYDKALNAQPQSTNMQLLQMKRDDLGNINLLDS